MSEIFTIKLNKMESILFVKIVKELSKKEGNIGTALLQSLLLDLGTYKIKCSKEPLQRARREINKPYLAGVIGDDKMKCVTDHMECDKLRCKNYPCSTVIGYIKRDLKKYRKWRPKDWVRNTPTTE